MFLITDEELCKRSLTILEYFLLTGISTSLEYGFLIKTKGTNGLIFLISIIFPSLSSQAATKGKKTNREWIAPLWGLSKLNNKALAFSRRTNISPLNLCRPLHFLTSRNKFLILILIFSIFLSLIFLIIRTYIFICNKIMMFKTSSETLWNMQKLMN